jgi:predicted DNA-binding protein
MKTEVKEHFGSQVVVRMPDEMKDTVITLAEMLHLTPSEFIRDAINKEMAKVVTRFKITEP